MAENGKNHIQHLDGNGYIITEWGTFGSLNGQFNSPYGIAVDPTGGHVYVSDSGNGRIQKFDSYGHFTTKLGTIGTADGQFKLPESVAVRSNWKCVCE